MWITSTDEIKKFQYPAQAFCKQLFISYIPPSQSLCTSLLAQLLPIYSVLTRAFSQTADDDSRLHTLR